MVPRKFNIVDFGGFDLASQYGSALPGIYDKIVDAYWNCVYIMCFGLKFGGFDIAPQYMTPEMFSDHIMLNGIISIDQNDVITVPSIVPPAPPPATHILSGPETPISSDGENGDIYLQYISTEASNGITNVRMVISAVRSTGSDVQVSEVQLLDSNGDVVLWGSGIATSNGNIFSQTQTPEKAFDNITNDKWYTNSRPSASVPIWIDFELSAPISTNVTAWQWWTGGDSINRDPVSFALQLSWDGGTNYFTVDEVVGATITTSRNSLAYTHVINKPSDGSIVTAYCKVDGVWQNLIGSNIDDVNTGGFIST